MDKIFKEIPGMGGMNYIYDKRKDNDKNEIVQHIPDWASVDSVIESFNTVEELLSIPFVKHFSEREDFSYYAIASDSFHEEKDDDKLMAIYEDGKSWWVVGFIKNIKQITLPRIRIIYKNGESFTDKFR